MSTIIAAAGETVPLNLIVLDGDVSLVPKANIYNEAGALVGGPFILAHVAAGFYRTTFVVPTPEKFVVRYDIFDSSGFVDLSAGPLATREKGEDLIVADVPMPTEAGIADAVWDELRSGHGLSGSFGEAVRVLLGSQAKANFRIDNMVYDMNGFLASCRIRVFPTSAIAAASTSGGIGQGEIHTITMSGSPDGTFPALPTTVLGLLP